MTSTDTAGHPDVAEISDLTEGILPPSRTTDVRRHLDECELCADVHASLEEIRGLLGTMPGPPRMPDDVASRIDAALAAEALLNATAPDTVDAPALIEAHVSRETSMSADRPVGRPRSSTTGPGRKDRSRDGRRRIAVLGTVFTVAALGLGSVLLSSFNDGKPSDPSTQAAVFSGKKVETEVSALLAQSSGANSRAPQSLGVNTVPENNLKNKTVPRVPACVLQGIGREDDAMAAKKGTYDGDPAYLVVMPDAKDTSRVDAYVVDAACETDSSSSAKVLLTHSYTRSAG
ncbi:anti-sigma factor family protein [Streptomyces sp. WM6386]|uniref:anti-sigma factor family protein n=1 Tax=Streptomyces sp. WM6386 TaxID=1415558 RepID=UPI000619CAB2|nr:membrane protein [Streptomyces sp. WM6386]KKD09637.1 membrane protein [Streptomyces sp. WM6386]